MEAADTGRPPWGVEVPSSGQAKGLDAVFRSVAGSAYGTWLLGVLASGLVRYGLYCLLEAATAT
jgi:hypothetical protein